jgi:hypothetical protein
LTFNISPIITTHNTVGVEHKIFGTAFLTKGRYLQSSTTSGVVGSHIFDLTINAPNFWFRVMPAATSPITAMSTTNGLDEVECTFRMIQLIV